MVSNENFKFEDRLSSEPFVTSKEQYLKMYKNSVENRDQFWTNMANELLDWTIPFKIPYFGNFANGMNSWFSDGFLSPCFNLVDRHANANPNKVAIMFESDEIGGGYNVTYLELLKQVCQLASLLLSLGLKKGDVVTIYMPMIPETLVAMLATIRIGAMHSVVFAGFSAKSLRERIQNADSKLLITADEGRRGGRTVALKRIADDALKGLDSVKNTLVYKHTGNNVPWNSKQDIWWHETVPLQRSFIPAAVVNAEDPLFILYTSGSTGKPKAILHTSAGYLLGAACTTKYVFDTHKDDRFACAGDVGWITGHSYIVYGPLLLGCSTLVYEGTPTYPDCSRYWQIIERLKITQWYFAPTAIRLLKRAGDQYVKGDRSSLRVLGSVGEPIAPDVFNWYEKVVGGGNCKVVDTYWQTETGSHVITPLPYAIPTKPGSATLPFFGIEPAILDNLTGQEIITPGVEGVLCIKSPWPSIARTILGDDERFVNTYFKPYPGYYFTGDAASRDEDGYIWIAGRVDDIVNVSGHRLSTAEIEFSLINYPGVVEAAAVGRNDELTGQAICAFVSLRECIDASDVLHQELIAQVRRSIGPFATPKNIFFSDLPKTRSGKIMRRLLRKIVNGEGHLLGDLSTLSNPQSINYIRKLVHEKLGYTFEPLMHNDD